MTNTQTPVTGITPQVGKRYVTRGGWVTPPMALNDSAEYPFVAGGVAIDIDGCFIGKSIPHSYDLISEYVEPTVTDTFRRDLIARIYVSMVMSPEPQYRDNAASLLAESAISIADTLIEAMEEAK